MTVGAGLRERILALVDERPGITLEELIHEFGGAEPIHRLLLAGDLFADLKTESLEHPETVHLFLDRERWRLWRAGVEASEHASRRQQLTHSERVDQYERISRALGRRVPPRHQRTVLDRWHLIKPVILGQATIEQVVADARQSGEPAKDGRQSPCAGASRSTIFRYVADYRRAQRDHGLGLLGLVPRRRPGHTESRLCRRQLSLMDTVLDEIYEQGERPTLKSAYARFTDRCKKAGLRDPLSDVTFWRRMQQRDRDRSKRKRHGSKAADADRPYSDDLGILELLPKNGLYCGAVVHLDHTTGDVQLYYTDNPFETVTERPTVSAFVCAFTGMPLARDVSFDPPSSATVMRLLLDCARRQGWLPSAIVVDGGPEFESLYFEEVCAEHGITVIRRPRSSPRSGACVERFFRTKDTQFVHTLPGNTQASRDPRQMSREVDPKRLACLSLAMFEDGYDEYLFEVYPDLKHEGAVLSGRGATPRESWDMAVRKYGRAGGKRVDAADWDFQVSLLPPWKRQGGTAKVGKKTGIQVGHLRYWHPGMARASVVGTRVPVKIFPDHAGTVAACLEPDANDRERQGWVLCRVRHRYKTFKDCTRRQLELAIRILRLNDVEKISMRILGELLERVHADARLARQRRRDAARLRRNPGRPPLRLVEPEAGPEPVADAPAPDDEPPPSGASWDDVPEPGEFAV
ncbi:MAG: transposase family protein [Chloroflexi bacterium]|nr:transposase family protein [Chloroflexota bacterium]